MQEYKKLHPDAKKCMRVNSIIQSVIFLAAVLPLAFFVVKNWSQVIFGLMLAVAAALVIVDITVVPKLRYARYSYMINESVIRVKSGFLWVSETFIPMERLHKIQVSQGPIDRIFGLSSVKVTTAGGDGDIKFLKGDEAQQIAEGLKEKINQIAAEERAAGI